MRQLIRALSAVLLLLAIALVSALITMRLVIHGAEVRVPALSGLTLNAAAGRLHAAGLEAGIDGRFYSSVQPEGHVLTQSPEPGTLVRKSWRVRFTLSLGPQKIAIPSIDGLDESIAVVTIRRLGLQLGDAVFFPWAYAPDNTVIAQTPVAGTRDAPSPRVSLLTATVPPSQPDAWIMPDLTGEPFQVAALTVLHAGFQLAPLSPSLPASPPLPHPANSGVGQQSAGNVSVVVPASGVPSGTVISQSPAAGSRILAGATVVLTTQP